MCNSFHYMFYNPETAFYQANLNRFCVVALLMQNQHDIKEFCKQMVVLDQKLTSISYGLWIVVTNVPLTFTINCQSYKPKTYDIKIESPFGIIKLNNTCKASNKINSCLNILANTYSCSLLFYYSFHLKLFQS